MKRLLPNLVRTLATCAIAVSLAGTIGCSTTPPPAAGPSGAVAKPSPTPTVTQAEPLLHLKLDGNLDDSGSGHLAVKPIGSVSYKPGRNGQAVEIDAPAHYLEVDLGTRLDLTKGATLEVWFQVAELKAPPGLTTTQQLVALEPLALAVQSSGMVRGFQTGTDKKTIFFQSDVRQVKPGQWHHAAIVADPNVTHTTTLYLDGKAQQTNGQMDVSFSPDLNAPLRIGLGDKATWPFKGLIDDVRFYDFGRSPEQVAEAAK